jgi:hypothetical protein
MLAGAGVDAMVLLASAGVTIVAGLAFGMAPALLASRIDPEVVLRAGSSGSSSRRHAAVRESLVVVEVALAVVLVAGAGLMAESLWHLSRVDLGFQPHGVLSVRIQPSSGQVKSIEATTQYFDELTRRIARSRRPEGQRRAASAAERIRWMGSSISRRGQFRLARTIRTSCGARWSATTSARSRSYADLFAATDTVPRRRLS